MSSPPRRGAGSPTRLRRFSAIPNGVPKGFLAPPKPKRRPIEELSVRELRDQHERNARILSSPAPSTSTYVERISTEQAAIESRLIDLVGVEAIRSKLEGATIAPHKWEDNMNVDGPEQPPLARAIGAKQRALARYAPQTSPTTSPADPVKMDFTFQDAMRLEQEAVAAERRRHEETLDKKRRRGVPIKGEVLTRAEQEARIRAFMSYKPTESDMEDDEDEDEDDEDPAAWFDDDQDDGRKGQDIVEPDDANEDLAHIIRVDESRVPGVFYEPRDGN